MSKNKGPENHVKDYVVTSSLWGSLAKNQEKLDQKFNKEILENGNLKIDDLQSRLSAIGVEIEKTDTKIDRVSKLRGNVSYALNRKEALERHRGLLEYWIEKKKVVVREAKGGLKGIDRDVHTTRKDGTVELSDVASGLIVKRGDTLGTMVKKLTGKLDWNMQVEYRSSKLAKGRKPKILLEANLIYPGQKVWIEHGKIVVADKKNVVAKKTTLKKASAPERKDTKERETLDKEALGRASQAFSSLRKILFDKFKVLSKSNQDAIKNTWPSLEEGDDLVSVNNKSLQLAEIQTAIAKMEKQEKEKTIIKESKPELKSKFEQVPAIIPEKKLPAEESDLGNHEADAADKAKEPEPEPEPEPEAEPSSDQKIVDLQNKIKALEHDETAEKTYKKNLLAAIDKQDYTFDGNILNGTIFGRKASRDDFVKKVLDKSKNGKIKPPQTIDELKKILGEKKTRVKYRRKAMTLPLEKAETVQRNIDAKNKKVLSKIDSWVAGRVEKKDSLKNQIEGIVQTELGSTFENIKKYLKSEPVDLDEIQALMTVLSVYQEKAESQVAEFTEKNLFGADREKEWTDLMVQIANKSEILAKAYEKALAEYEKQINAEIVAGGMEKMSEFVKEKPARKKMILSASREIGANIEDMTELFLKGSESVSANEFAVNVEADSEGRLLRDGEVVKNKTGAADQPKYLAYSAREDGDQFYVSLRKNYFGQINFVSQDAVGNDKLVRKSLKDMGKNGELNKKSSEVGVRFVKNKPVATFWRMKVGGAEYWVVKEASDKKNKDKFVVVKEDDDLKKLKLSEGNKNYLESLRS